MNITREGQVDISDLKYVPQGNTLRLRAGDVLFNNTNSPALVGKTAPILKDENWAFSNHMTRLRLVLGMDTCFIAIQFHYLWMTGYFRHLCVNHVNQASISTKLLADTVPIVIAPANEQRRIVQKIEELFSKLDAGVAALERVRAALKRYRAAVLKAAVEGKLTAQWRTRHPVQETGAQLLRRILDERRRKWEQEQRAKYAKAGKQLPKGWQAKYKEPAGPDTSELPALPENWCWATVEQVGEVRLGRQRSPKNRSDKYPTKYIRAANITEQGLDLEDVLEMDFKPTEQEVYQLNHGDLVLSEASGSPDQAGKPAIWNGEIPNCCFQNTVLRFRPSGIGSNYSLTVFRHCYFNKIFAQVASGVGINHLSAAKFSLIPFPVAPLDEQEQIVAEVERRLSIVDEIGAQIEASLKRASRLRQSILKLAFEGRLVPQDPHDEPAEHLLQRIRQAREGDDGHAASRRKPKASTRSRKNEQPGFFGEYNFVH